MKHLLLTAALAVAALGLTACGDSGSGGSGSSSAAGDGSYTVGINQLVSHPALDGAAEGFKEAFKDAGLDVTFEEQNAQGEQATVTSIASTFANDADVDLVAAIATLPRRAPPRP